MIPRPILPQHRIFCPENPLLIGHSRMGMGVRGKLRFTRWVFPHFAQSKWGPARERKKTAPRRRNKEIHP